MRVPDAGMVSPAPWRAIQPPSVSAEAQPRTPFEDVAIVIEQPDPEPGAPDSRRASARAPSSSTTSLDRKTLAGRIDHTLLVPDASAHAIERLCAEALQFSFATVCVHGAWVRRCAEALAASPVGVSAVVGFPLGATATPIKVAEAELAIAEGAREIDMVLFVGALKSGDDERAYGDVARVASACHDCGARLKLILETCLLTADEVVRGCRIAERAGADFVKTSTGFSRRGATVEDVALLHRLVGGRLGIKASGGIRDLASARAMLDAGATRLGTSASVAILSELGT